MDPQSVEQPRDQQHNRGGNAPEQTCLIKARPQLESKVSPLLIPLPAHAAGNHMETESARRQIGVIGKASVSGVHPIGVEPRQHVLIPDLFRIQITERGVIDLNLSSAHRQTGLTVQRLLLAVHSDAFDVHGGNIGTGCQAAGIHHHNALQGSEQQQAIGCLPCYRLVADVAGARLHPIPHAITHRGDFPDPPVREISQFGFTDLEDPVRGAKPQVAWSVIENAIDEIGQQAWSRGIGKKPSVFARLSPLQKERIIHALHANNHTVGYLGDGINDAPALKAADVGISVNNAVDIAKESADIILLKKSLTVLEDGVIEGRKTFGNILKYIKMGASSNFGNMFSMTGASIFLPFLPMLPIQILLNNFLYDVSQIAIPSDEVDKDYLLKSRPWNIEYIKKFIILIGPISSIFDFITFGVLLWVFHAPQGMFSTGWFLESLCTQTLVIHIIRTGKIPFIESRPSQFLIFTSIYIVTIGLVLPFTTLGKYFKFVVPPPLFFLILVIIIAAYLLLVQLVKSWFIKKYGYE